MGEWDLAVGEMVGGVSGDGCVERAGVGLTGVQDGVGGYEIWGCGPNRWRRGRGAEEEVNEEGGTEGGSDCW